VSNNCESQELKVEIEALRAQVAALTRTVQELSEPQPPRPRQLLDRRRLLTLAPLAAVAAVGANVALPQSASAAPPDGSFNDLTGNTLEVSDTATFFGHATFNDPLDYAPSPGGMADPGSVSIGGRLGSDAQVVIRGGADAVSDQDALRLDAPGKGIDSSSFGPAITAVARNSAMKADAALVENHGRGRGLWVKSLNSANTFSTVTGTNQGTGSGLWGSSVKGDGVVGAAPKGRGARFSGGAANVRLVPGKRAAHPVSGQAGDLYVDKSNRLWFCTKTSSATAKWKRLG
jgi:hypothetical protein